MIACDVTMFINEGRGFEVPFKPLSKSSSKFLLCGIAIGVFVVVVASVFIFAG